MRLMEIYRDNYDNSPYYQISLFNNCFSILDLKNFFLKVTIKCLTLVDCQVHILFSFVIYIGLDWIICYYVFYNFFGWESNFLKLFLIASYTNF